MHSHKWSDTDNRSACESDCGESSKIPRFWIACVGRRLMVSARKGGSRDPQTLYDNLVSTCKLARNIILVDDVRTTGAHLKAVSAKVRSEGGQCLGALCAGPTVLTQEKEPFSILEEELPDFIPK